MKKRDNLSLGSRHPIYGFTYHRYHLMIMIALILAVGSNLNDGICAAKSASPFVHSRPIIFIPGIAGSFLRNEAGREVWPNIEGFAVCILQVIFPGQENCDKAAIKPLELAADGRAPASDTPEGRVDIANGGVRPADGELSGVLDLVSLAPFHIPLLTRHFYDITAQNFAASGYTLARSDQDLRQCALTLKCWIPAAVDWRKSSAFNAERLLRLLQQVLTLTHTDRVDILAHSQGGLITNALLHMPASLGKIYRVVTLGTPYLGVPLELSNLLFQQPCPSFEKGPGPLCLLDPAAQQVLTENYPGAMELLPSSAYYEGASSPLMSLSNGKLIRYTYEEAHSLVEQILTSLGRDMRLVDEAAKFHQAVDDWDRDPPLDPQVRLLRMIGYDSADATPTCPQAPCAILEQVGSYSQGGTLTTTRFSANGPNQGKEVTFFYGSGDGLVPLYSASLYNPLKGFDLRYSQHNLYFCAVSHVGLAQAQEVWEAALPFLEGTATYSQDMIMGKRYLNRQTGQSGHCPDGTDGTLQL